MEDELVFVRAHRNGDETSTEMSIFVGKSISMLARPKEHVTGSVLTVWWNLAPRPFFVGLATLLLLRDRRSC